MNSNPRKNPYVTIPCGGTGGHLFPGLAVGEQLKQRGCDVALLISPKEIDQQGVKSASGMEIFTLPAVGLQNRNYLSFAGSFVKSLFAARKIFRQRKPSAVLAMGGFTSAPPIFVAKEMKTADIPHGSERSGLLFLVALVLGSFAFSVVGSVGMILEVLFTG